MDAPTTSAPTSRWNGRAFRRGVVLSVLLVLGSIGLWQADLRAETGLPVGAHDFIAYWSAHDVVASGGDPYDADVLRSAQTDLHPRYEDGAQRFWNPPWALLPLLPILVLPFELATSAWLVLSAAAAAACVVISWRLFVDDGEIPPLAVGISLVFLPVVECLELGQMGAVITLVVLGALLAIRRGRDLLAGMLLSLTIVKPQAAILVLLFVGVHLLHTRRWTVVGVAVACAGIVVSASRLLHPTAWAGWDAESTPTHWHSATIAGWLRSSLDGSPEWPLLVVPVGALLVALPFALRHRARIPWPAIPSLLALSILVAPYAWIADAVLLLPIVVVAVAAAYRRLSGGAFLLIGVTAVQLITLAVRAGEGTGLQHLIVLPLGLLAVALVAQHRTLDRSPASVSAP